MKVLSVILFCLSFYRSADPWGGPYCGRQLWNQNKDLDKTRYYTHTVGCLFHSVTRLKRSFFLSFPILDAVWESEGGKKKKNASTCFLENGRDTYSSVWRFKNYILSYRTDSSLMMVFGQFCILAVLNTWYSRCMMWNTCAPHISSYKVGYNLAQSRGRK